MIHPTRRLFGAIGTDAWPQVVVFLARTLAN